MAGNRQCGGRTAPSNGRGLRDAGDAWGGAGQTAAKETKARPVSGQEGSILTHEVRRCRNKDRQRTRKKWKIKIWEQTQKLYKRKESILRKHPVQNSKQKMSRWSLGSEGCEKINPQVQRQEVRNSRRGNRKARRRTLANK